MKTLDLKRYQSAKRVEQWTDVLNVGSVSVDVQVLDRSRWGRCSDFGNMVAESLRLKKI